MTNTYTVTVYDELHGGSDTLTIKAKTIEQVVYIVESNPKHEYEIIEIEKE
tara:strand:+ start:218 stop:370 length:153 start_codon:yes stop_codon:yes gene_type:complete